jgi:hypothetical protein
MMGKITNVTHVRELNGLELQAVEMALEDGLNDTGLILTLGTESSGGNKTPFVALCRHGSNREVIVHFRDNDKTAETRRKDDAQEAGKTVTASSSVKTTSKPAAKSAAKKALPVKR